jgi:HPt (histidine-containing phosphotransfer) domain-containing protein
MSDTLYNLTYLKEIANDDPELELQLIEIFVAQIPEFISNMKNFLQSGDLKMLGKEAHTAKSSILVFGMAKTSEILKKIQIDVENGEIANLEKLINAAETDLNQVLRELNAGR